MDSEADREYDREWGVQWNGEWDKKSRSIARKLRQAADELGYPNFNAQKVKEILSSEEFRSQTPERKRNILDTSLILVTSAINKHWDLVKQILEWGGDPNVQDGEGRTALHGASEYGNSSTVSLLVEKGSDVNKRTKVGSTPLMLSHRKGHFSTCVLLLQLGADIQDIKDQINHKDWQGRTLLHRAVEKRDEKVVNLIVSKGNPDLSILYGDLQTAFLLAKDVKEERIANLLEAKETQQTFQRTFLDILKSKCVDSTTCCRGLAVLLSKLEVRIQDIRDGNGESPLSLSHFNGHYDTCVRLLQLDANIEDIKDKINCQDEDGWTLLHRAVEKGEEKVVNQILSKCNPDLSLLNSDLQTSFVLAKNLKQEGIASLLETKETADTFKRSFFEIIKSSCARSKKCCEGLKMLLTKLKMTIQDIQDEDGSKPLKLSHYYGHYDMAVHFIELGASIKDLINYQDQKGCTIVHRAAEMGDKKIARLVLSKGNADLTILNSDLQTPFLLARKLKQDAVASLIERKETTDTFQTALVNILKNNCIDSKKCCDGLEILVKKLEMAKLDILDEEGFAPFMLSHLNEHYSTTVLLLNIISRTRNANESINEKDRQGCSLLHRAVEKGDMKTVELLLSQKNIDLSVINQNFQTAHILAEKLRRGTIAELIKARETPETLTRAVIGVLKNNCIESEFCCQSLIDLLLLHNLEMTALLDITDEETSFSALALASKYGHSTLLKKVFESFDENALWKDEENPPLIWHASNADQYEAVQVLLNYEHTNQNWNVEVQDGTNSLTIALLKKFDKIISLMMNCSKIKCDKSAQEACTQFGQFGRISKCNIDALKHCELALKGNEVDSAKQLFSQLSPAQKQQLEARSDEIHNLEMRKILNLPGKPRTSDLIKLTKKYPLSNKEIEKNQMRLENKHWLYLPQVEAHINEEFCCIAIYKETHQNQQLIAVRDVDTSKPCLTSCLRQDECQSVADMIKLCQLLEEEMNNGDVSKVQFKFIVVGSVAEGTRIGDANEMDISVEFKRHNKSPFLIRENATELCNRSDDFFDDFHVFNFPKFLEWFLRYMHECLSKIDPAEIPSSIEVFLDEFDPESCHDCLNARNFETIYTPYTHCMNHLTTVTTRNVGGCLVFRWNGRVQSIDIIPIFHIESNGVLELFDKVTKTLLKHQYPNWLTHLHKQRHSDVILPETMAGLKREKNISLCAIKILHFGPNNNYIIKPAQEMKISNFHGMPRLKEVYNHIKVIKSGFNIEVKSYFIKKILMLSDFRLKSEDKSVKLSRLLFDALSHPELKPFFSIKINFQEWQSKLERNDFNVIPLVDALEEERQEVHLVQPLGKFKRHTPTPTLMPKCKPSFNSILANSVQRRQAIHQPIAVPRTELTEPFPSLLTADLITTLARSDVSRRPSDVAKEKMKDERQHSKQHCTKM